jgi:glutamate-ammonia-ligase adenylyltransferase
MRLRPFGEQGELVSTISGLRKYYAATASLWEIQAALKLRPIAGNLKMGDDLLRKIRPILLLPRSRDQVAGGIENMRRQVISRVDSGHGGTDVKNGWGGLRDIEFLAQGLQLIHAHQCPRLIEGNTLRALDLLHEEGLLRSEDAGHLKEDYLFLRLVEHRLQILDDRQIHRVPVETEKIDILAKRVLGGDSTGNLFMDRLNAARERIRKAYVHYLLDGSGAP